MPTRGKGTRPRAGLTIRKFAEAVPIGEATARKAVKRNEIATLEFGGQTYVVSKRTLLL